MNRSTTAATLGAASATTSARERRSGFATSIGGWTIASRDMATRPNLVIRRALSICPTA